MAYVKQIDHVCLDPQGRARRNGIACTADRKDKQRANSRSFVATSKLRAKLWQVKIVQHDSSWVHMKGDEIVAWFDDVGAAVAAL